MSLFALILRLEELSYGTVITNNMYNPCYVDKIQQQSSIITKILLARIKGIDDLSEDGTYA